jgi:monoamine oxidase
MGWMIKVHGVYPSRFWREDEGLSGAVTSDQGAIRTTADNSPPSGSPAILVGFEGVGARRLAAFARTEGRRDRRLRTLLWRESCQASRLLRILLG